MEEDFYCSENDRRRSVFEAIFEKVHDIVHLVIALGSVLRAEVKDNSLTPLIEIFDAVKERDNQLPSDFNASLVSTNFVDGIDCVDDNETVCVVEHCVYLLKQLLIVLFEVRFVMMEHLDDTDDRSFFDVGIRVL